VLAVGDSNPLLHIRRPWVNHGLMLACVLGFLLPLPLEHLALLPAQITGSPDRPQGIPLWPETHWSLRLLAYQFLHAGWLHLIGNLLMLWVFGDNVEDAMGHLRYLGFFLVCGVAGGFAEALFSAHSGVPVVGASGAIAGVMGAYLLLHPRARILVLVGMRFPVIVPASVFVGLWIGLDVLSALAGFQGEQLIAWWAHIGGFAAGMLLIPPLRRRDVALLQPADSYPAQAFGRAGRVLLDLTPKTPVGARLSDRMVAGLKAAGFLLLIAVLVEVFLP
jgi:membrane associated rhomboid family serine protease